MTESPVATRVTGRRIREIILEQSRRAHVGHIGSALSVADIIAAVYGRIANISTPEDADRDRFILSKGHAALALYAALALRGWIDMAMLDTYCGDESLLGVHPEHALRGVDFCTGSLGQGLSMAAGAALAARRDGSTRRVYALLSDAELNEGSTWEAVMFLNHQRLDNLCAFIDLNGQQALGYTRDVVEIPNVAERLRAFGWEAIEVDGHDVDALAAAALAPSAGRPRAIVAKTTFGKGVSYMHNLIKWHYLPMDDEQFAQAMAEVRAS
jgi:transketolase